MKRNLIIALAGIQAFTIANVANAQILFVSGGNSINAITPGGVQSTFASGLPTFPNGLAFDGAGNLFVANYSILKFTPGGVESTFASGVGGPDFLAFNSAGTLFEAAHDDGSIYEFTPGGVRSIFASGLGTPAALAFNSAGNLFAVDTGSGNIYEITPGGVTSLFASVPGSVNLAFQGVTLPVPEPSVFGILAIGAVALVLRRR